MTPEIVDLADRFDAVVLPWLEPCPRPTKTSIRKIEAHFGVNMPDDLVKFARSSRHFGNWFASLGPNYHDRGHIIRCNSYWRRRRRTRRLSRDLVAFTLGFDEEMDCFDLSAEANGELGYPVCYWSPETGRGISYASFRDYIIQFIESSE